MDISRGETFDENPKPSESMAMETGDQEAEGEGLGAMKDLEPKKSESMMDIEENPMATETGDQRAEGEGLGGMNDMEPKKSETELMAEFDSNEAKYKNFPTSPASRR